MMADAPASKAWAKINLMSATVPDMPPCERCAQEIGLLALFRKMTLKHSKISIVS